MPFHSISTSTKGLLFFALAIDPYLTNLFIGTFKAKSKISSGKRLKSSPTLEGEESPSSGDIKLVAESRMTKSHSVDEFLPVYKAI